MLDSQARLQALIAKLKTQGYRLTPQRMAVVNALVATEGHPSVEQIYARVRADFPTTSIATVYKTVTLLKEMGELLELSFGTESNRYDGNRPYPHPHLICTRCRKIIDPPVTMVDGLTQEVAQLTGYQVLSHRLDFYGLCPDCRQGR